MRIEQRDEAKKGSLKDKPTQTDRKQISPSEGLLSLKCNVFQDPQDVETKSELQKELDMQEPKFIEESGQFTLKAWEGDAYDALFSTAHDLQT